VPRLVYRAAARRAIAEIAAYIERERKSRAIADDFIDTLTDYCENIARLPGQMGRPAPNSAATFAAPPTATMSFFCATPMKMRPAAICNHVAHGARDMDAYFLQHRDDD
jgi:toxin ParE1/3/4